MPMPGERTMPMTQAMLDFEKKKRDYMATLQKQAADFQKKVEEEKRLEAERLAQEDNKPTEAENNADSGTDKPADNPENGQSAGGSVSGENDRTDETDLRVDGGS